MARKDTEVRYKELTEKVKIFCWTEQELEFLLETVHRWEREIVKNVNNVAANILPNRGEVAIQRISSRQEYKPAEERVRQKELLSQRALDMPRRTLTTEPLTLKPITRTPLTLPTVPPTPTQHRHSSFSTNTTNT